MRIATERADVKAILQDAAMTLTALLGVPIRVYMTCNMVLDIVEKDRFIDDVCALLGVPRSQALSHVRKRAYSEARMLISYYLVRHSSADKSAIARMLGYDHTTILYHERTVRELLEAGDPSIVEKHYRIYKLMRSYENETNTAATDIAGRHTEQPVPGDAGGGYGRQAAAVYDAAAEPGAAAPLHGGEGYLPHNMAPGTGFSILLRDGAHSATTAQPAIRANAAAGPA